MKDDFYKKLYNDLYSTGKYINDYQSSHLWDERYPIESLGFFIEELDYNTVLDVGCGIGNGLNYLKSHGKDVKGIDVSEWAVNKSKERGFDVQVSSITNIPFPDNYFDLVTTTDVLEHLYIEDIKKSIKEIIRVSKKYIAVKIATIPERGSVDLLKSLNYDYIKNLHLSVYNADIWEKMFKIFDLRMLTKKIRKHIELDEIHVIFVYEKVI